MAKITLKPYFSTCFKRNTPIRTIIIKILLLFIVFGCFINALKAQEIILPGRFSIQVIEAEQFQKLAQIEADTLIAPAPKIWAWKTNGFWKISNGVDTLTADGFQKLPYYSFLIEIGNYIQIIKNRDLHNPLAFKSPLFNSDSTLVREGRDSTGVYEHIHFNYKTEKKYLSISDDIKSLGYYIAQLPNNQFDLLNNRLELIKAFQNIDSIAIHLPKYFAIKQNNTWKLTDFQARTVGKMKNLAALKSISENVHWVRFQNGTSAFVDTFLNIYAKANSKPQLLNEKAALSKNAADSIVLINNEGCLLDTSLRNEAYYAENHFVLDNGSEFQIFDEAGKLFYTGTYFQEILPSTELLFKVKKKNKWGFANREGIIRIPCRYLATGNVFNGVVPVLLREKWAFVDRADNFKIQPILDTLENFCDGTSIAVKNKKFGVLNIKAEWIIDARYELVQRLTNGWFLVKDKSKFGLYDANGGRKLVPIYEELKVHKDGKITFKLNGKKGLYDASINLIVPAVNQNLHYDDVNRMIFIYN